MIGMRRAMSTEEVKAAVRMPPVEAMALWARDGLSIPPMSDPLGQHWKQPSRGKIEIDCTHALMPRSAFDQLLEYSSSIPTGVYSGKMWKCCNPPVGWLLRWYGNPCEDDGSRLWQHQKHIIIVEGE